MEIILAIVASSAVIFFGAIISMGNERQRRAIDNLREQMIFWAMQDLRVKREKLMREICVENPLDWLNRAVTPVIDRDLHISVNEYFREPQALGCQPDDGSRILFTPLSPIEIRRKAHIRRDRLAQHAVINPILSLPRNVRKEMTILNSRILFDLELPQVWKALSGEQMEKLYRL